MRCKPHARFGRRPGETEQTATLSPRPGPTSPRWGCSGPLPAPGPARAPRPPRAHGRPAVPGQADPAHRRRPAHRPATRTPHRTVRRQGPRRGRGHLGDPATDDRRLPRPRPHLRPSSHDRSDQGSPRGRPGRTDRAAAAGPKPSTSAPPIYWRTSTGPAPATAQQKPSTAASNTSEAPPSGSATSPTTSPAACSRPAASGQPSTPDCDEPV